MTELEAWRDLYGQLRERGALLVAISPETQRQSDFAVQQHGIPFPLLYDPGAKIAEQFGLVYTVPDYHQRYLKSVLVNLPFVNGEASWRLPLPATYVVAQDGARHLRGGARGFPSKGLSRKTFWLRYKIDPRAACPSIESCRRWFGLRSV